MLNSLHIENIAVIKSADIDLERGFTVFSGETGAGKSVIIECIKLLLGSRFDKELIRYGETVATVSAYFNGISAEAIALLSDVGVAVYEDELTVLRSVSIDGKNQVKINGRTVGVSVLKTVIPMLISIHGQNETNALADSSAHLSLVDIYADNSELLSRYSQIYNAYTEVKSELSELLDKRNESERLRELLLYQIKDIDSLNLHNGEEEELIDKKLKIRAGERLHKHADFVYKALRGSEKGSVSYLIDRSISSLQQISDVVPVCSEYAEIMGDILAKIEEIAEDVSAITDDIAEDPTEALNIIEARLDKISKLKRKYGLTIASILEYRNKCSKELESIENSEQIEKNLRKREAELYNDALILADDLHARRVIAAESLEKAVKETLDFLDMPGVVFYTSFSQNSDSGKKELNSFGYERAEFYISANNGAEPLPMSKIASGGELARIMLALKSAIADKDGVSTVIYDEIDAGVSGKTARKIGIKMHSLAKNSQIIAVTHSAQIASLADTHILIKKRDCNGKVQTEVSKLDYDGRVTEVSRILGGINVTKAQKEAAIDMLQEKHKLS